MVAAFAPVGPCRRTRPEKSCEPRMLLRSRPRSKTTLPEQVDRASDGESGAMMLVAQGRWIQILRTWAPIAYCTLPSGKTEQCKPVIYTIAYLRLLYCCTGH